VAIAGTELDQAPPVEVLVHVADDPIHKGDVPLIVCKIGAEMVMVLVAVLTQLPEATV